MAISTQLFTLILMKRHHMQNVSRVCSCALISMWKNGLFLYVYVSAWMSVYMCDYVPLWLPEGWILHVSYFHMTFSCEDNASAGSYGKRFHSNNASSTFFIWKYEIEDEAKAYQFQHIKYVCIWTCFECIRTCVCVFVYYVCVCVHFLRVCVRSVDLCLYVLLYAY